MLGTSLVPTLVSAGHSTLATDVRLLDKDTEALDVRNLDAFTETADNFRPSLLVHLAAETDLEICEKNIDYAYQENFIGTQNACRVCHSLGIPLVYVSTAGVFDGEKNGPYTEFDRPRPINIYGASKYEGEKIVRSTLPSHYIVRAGWMVGGGERDRKFVSKIIAQLRAGLKSINAVIDKSGTPTYAPAFSEMLLKIMAKGCYGTYHLSCRGRASRFEVASFILRTLGRDDVKLNPVTSDFFISEYFAPRPKSEDLRNYVLELRSMNEMPHWRDAIERYLRDNFKEDFV